MVSPGRVLVAGGVDEAGIVLSSVGVFDVDNGTWHQMPDMNEVSSVHIKVARDHKFTTKIRSLFGMKLT